MGRRIQGTFTYLVDYMNKNNVSISQAAKKVDRNYSTIRNWLYGMHLEGAIMATAEETPKQADRNVAHLISKITGDSKETVLDEIRKHLIASGKLEISNNSVSDTLKKLVEDVKIGKVRYMCNNQTLTEERSRRVLAMLENDLRLLETF